MPESLPESWPDSLTQSQIDAIVARAVETVCGIAPDPGYVYALPSTPTRASKSAQPDGWCDVGTVVDVPAGLSYLVWWHPMMRCSRIGWETT